jgi:DNA-binding NarL/FixJ family response regulator
MINILFAEDHAIVRNGLKQIFDDAPDITVVGEAANGAEVLEIARKLEFDVLLTDLTMPGVSGTELIKRLLADNPAMKILVLSMNIESQTVNRTLNAGAAGYVTKDSDQSVLLAAIRKVASGGKFIDPSLVDAMVFDKDRAAAETPHAILSDRELQILQMLASGQTPGEIAKSLFLSIKTVSTHKTNLMHKLGIDNNSDLVRYAIKHGLVRE